MNLGKLSLNKAHPVKEGGKEEQREGTWPSLGRGSPKNQKGLSYPQSHLVFFTLSLGLLSAPIPSFSGIGKVMKFY